MIRIVEIKNKREQKRFLDFPYTLYKGNSSYTPPLYSDEKLLFSKKNVYFDTCESVFFNAYDGDKHVGRIQGIIQKASNAKTGENRVRFTRFDSINDQNVAKALFDAVEKWAISKNCDILCGPLGYSDLEREGLLIEGFEETNTFEEQYNLDYYPALVESVGLKKEVDWIEYRIFKPKQINERVKRIKERVLERYGLHMAKCKNTRELIDKYKDGIFHVLDEGYKDIYGTVPFTDSMKKQMIDQFNLIIKLDYVGVVLDKDDRVVAFGLCFPAIGDALKGGNGKLYPATLLRMLKIIAKPKRLDLGLIAVLPSYKSLGVNSIVIDGLIELMINKDIEYCETNLMLEENYPIQAQWKYFDFKQHKRRRAYVKQITF